VARRGLLERMAEACLRELGEEPEAKSFARGQVRAGVEMVCRGLRVSSPADRERWGRVVVQAVAEAGGFSVTFPIKVQAKVVKR
jgi:hypothetical protein